MKSIPTKCIANTAWGLCYKSKVFNSKKEAREYGKWMVENGYAFAYRLFPLS